MKWFGNRGSLQCEAGPAFEEGWTRVRDTARWLEYGIQRRLHTAERHIHADNDLPVNRHALSLGTSILVCQVPRYSRPRDGTGNVSVYTRPPLDIPNRTRVQVEFCVRKPDGT